VALRERFGVAKGDRVVLAMRNLPEFVIAFWACQVLGAIAVPLNAWWTGPELAWAVGDAGPALAVIDGERWQRLRDSGHLAGLRAIVTRVPDGELAGAVQWRTVLTGYREQDELPACEIAPGDPATTSSGRPKPGGAGPRMARAMPPLRGRRRGRRRRRRR
jgi:long-chain acyl-CoA synthetase